MGNPSKRHPRYLFRDQLETLVTVRSERAPTESLENVKRYRPDADAEPERPRPHGRSFWSFWR